MSTPFYDLASLVVVPSGYKASKVYAQKPLTTDGQLTFSRASTATRVNSAGLIETVSSNVPRLDYLGSTCPKLLLEPQRSNVITRSSEFDHSDWTKRNATITANAVTSPDGTTNADKLAEDTSNDRHDFYQGFSVTSGTTYTLSFFAKAAERTFCYASFGSSNVNAQNAYFNLSTGAVVSSPAGVTSSMTAYGNGWYRCVMTATASGTGVAYFVYGNSNNGTGFVYTGTTGSGTYVYGAQLEAGAYSTSLIPTTTAAVTRVLDRAVKGSVSSLIGQSAGTLYGKFTFDSSETVNRVFSITGADWNSNGSIRLDIISNKPEIYARKAGADIGSQGSINYTISKGQTIKWALVYTASTMKLFIDGAQRGSTTTLSTTPPACSELFINELGGGFTSALQNNQRTLWSEVLLFTSALTDAQAIEITTP